MAASTKSKILQKNPLLWTPKDLKLWLETFENGRFKEYANVLGHLTGKELHDYGSNDWQILQNQDLATSLRFTFMGICSVAATDIGSPNLQIRLAKDNQIEEKLNDGFKKSKPVKFPPMLAIPSIGQIIFVSFLTIAFILSITVFKKPLVDIGVTTEDIIKYGSIPVISVVFTYFHIWLALYMTFYPLEFIGCLRIPGTNVGLGWEGIIPFKGEKMARTSVRMMTEQLMDVKEVFSKIDPSQVVVELEPMLYNTIHDIIESMAMKYNPGIWKMLPDHVKTEIILRVKEESPQHIEDMMNEIRNNIETVFDLEDMVVSNLLRDKQLLVNMFVTCGYAELAFIRNSGAYMGGIFGIGQMILWFFYTNRVVVFPVVGLLVGTVTNWLALKMIFEPVNPKKIGCFTLHGLFLRRQAEVAAEYGRMVAADVLTSKNIIEAILKGPASDKLFDLVYQNVKKSVDAGASVTDKIVQIGIGKETYAQIKEDACTLVVEKFPDSLRRIEAYATKAMDLESTLREKMRELSYEEFEGLLHPVFQEDEWKLVLMGGALGLFIGLIQAFGINV